MKNCQLHITRMHNK